ncbi:chemotaxis protein CheA [Desulfosporosinus hippei]|uniref:Chemotaxis protein CheA n=1 Tax=Desulfosporosinus hippei DSM 8344 TaxID=1121419 RepID=A0A1G7WBU8_9FIRM|nr:chemotaxis protein CheA [Desulfosporosinus hippei]SDG69422.1 two-component system, chemotaxis family, sensor kinase CheA [Desulfosporosinus hippei DSM 8344]
MLFKFSRDDLDMLQSFVEEAEENLQKIEEALLTQESLNENPEALNEIFRQMHTIKGLSSFFGLSDITRLSHEAEYMLDALRTGRLVLTTKVVALLLDALDILVDMVGQLNVVCQEAHAEEWVTTEITSNKDIDCVVQQIQEVIASYGLAEKVAVDTGLEIPNSKNSIIEPEKIEASVGEPEELAVPKKDNPPLSPANKEGLGVGLLEDFLEEADEHLSMISDKLLIDLDSHPEDTSILKELFRRVHSLKGNIGLLLSVQTPESKLRALLEGLLEVFQNVEGLLDWVRNQTKPVLSEVTNLCYLAMEALRKGITITQTGGDSTQLDLQPLLQELKVTRERLTNSGTQSDGSASSPLSKKQEALPKTETLAIHVSQSVRVSEEKLNRLMNVIGELVVTKNVFGLIARKLIIDHDLPTISREVKDAGLSVNRISEELEDIIMSMRMTAVRHVFQKFPRIIRDIALKTGKNIALIMEGEDTELDKTIIEQMADPLMHLVRNAADHGIESEDQRVAVGKEAQGKVWLRAYNRGKHVYIEVEDDGKGLDAQALKRKAHEKGFISEAQAAEMSDESAFQLVFLPGFSTAGVVSEISGRGVGMDVVKSNVNALQGKVHIVSQMGKGTKMIVQLPLTLLVSRGLLVEVNQQSYILPLENILETLKIPSSQLMKRRGQWILHHRGEVLGVVKLSDLLGTSSSQEGIEDRKSIVVVNDGGVKIGMIVDRLHHEQDVLVKPLPDYLSGILGMGGATIMTNGKVAIVLNAVELLAKACTQDNPSMGGN